MKPYISLPESVPGMRSLLTAYPETGQYLGSLAQQLLRGESSLTPAERELIAARVSLANDCAYCTSSHAATASDLFPEDKKFIVEEVIENKNDKVLSEKMQALIEIALAVKTSGKAVTKSLIDNARSAGADEKAIHDTVLVAAAFCMFNRYVDGLGTLEPGDRTMYKEIGKRLAINGYI
jgi:uncharacterized peroxidase-related enzyme